MSQPLDKVIWIDRSKLQPNDYNPNKVYPKELKLLQTSILETGWTQPIVVDENYVIIDGFHRFTVSGTPEVSKMTNGKVPIVVVKNIDPKHRRMATIRHNRARGTHGVLEMSKIVRFLSESGVTVEELCYRLGMEPEEVERLATRDGMPVEMLKNVKGFRKSWGVDLSKKTKK